MFGRCARGFGAALLLLLAGCGMYVPEIVPLGGPHATRNAVNKLLNHVKCELRDAVLSTIKYDKDNAAQQPDRKRHLKWLESWTGKLTLKIVVDEKGSFSPGATFTEQFINAQTFSLALGGTFSSQAVRTETVDYFFVFKSDFIDKAHEFDNRPEHCVGYDGVLVDGDLKIKEWLEAATFPFFLPENVHDKPPDVLSHEVSFIVVASGNITPTWKLVKVTATGSPLANVGRTHTNNMILTMGPGGDPKSKTPSKAVQDSHLAAQIGAAVAAAIKNQQ